MLSNGYCFNDQLVIQNTSGLRSLWINGSILSAVIKNINQSLKFFFKLSIYSKKFFLLKFLDVYFFSRYRICAVDHGMFSFIDHYVRDWPLILVTNPKDALLTMPSIEPLYRIIKSTHIRYY